MRTCKEIEPLLFNYVSGEILSSEKRVLDEHIKDCDLCLDEIMRLQRLDMDLITLKEESATPPEDLRDVILSNIAMKKKEGRLHKMISSTSILTVTTVVLAVLVFILSGKVDKISLDPTGSAGAKAVKILFFSDNAQNVSLVGDFNGWGAEPLILKSTSAGMWSAELKLPPGMYQYNLVVDGEKWMANPNAKAHIPDGFGGTNSVVVVNGNGETQIEKLGKEI